MRNRHDPCSTGSVGFRGWLLALALASATAAATPGNDDVATGRFVPAGDPGLLQVRLLADEAVTEDEFGFTVAIDGDTAVVGARLADIGDEVNRGAAYVFVRNQHGWSQQARLLASDGGFAQLFGQSVAIDGDTILVGAVGAEVDGIRRGAAYVYTRSGGIWQERTKLVADDGSFFDEFGAAVALDGDTALIGASSAHVGSNNAQGTAYVFTGAGADWQQQAKLLAADGASFNAFGNAVALSGDSAVIGAHQASVPDGFWQGTAYVFVRTGGAWTQQAKLAAAESAPGDQFGHSVAISGDTVLVGSQVANGERGAAYVFVRDAGIWSQQALLSAADAEAGDRFASALALWGDRAIVGAERQGATIGVDLDRGAAYLFRRVGSQWNREEKLVAADAGGGDRFGVAVALDDERYFVGAPGVDLDGISDRGAAYVFGTDKPQPPAAPRLTLDPEQVAVGLGAGDSVSVPLQIGNVGTDLALEWTVIETLATTPAPRLPLRTQARPSRPRPAMAAATGTTTISHSVSTQVLPENSVACADNQTGFTRVNRFLRVFHLADFGLEHGFEVSEVMFGIERLEPAADVVVNLYTVDGALNFVNFTRLATRTVSLAAQQGSQISVPIQASVPAGSTLVMEVVPPDLVNVGGRYFPGSNDAGQTAPSYTAAPACGANDPVTFASIGFEHVHLVMTVSGQAVAEPQCAPPSWFDVTPGSGSVAASSTQTIELGLDAGKLAAGVHYTDLCIASNDPWRPLVLIPVELEVAGGPVGELEVEPEWIDFGTVPAGISAGPAMVTLRNRGSAPLTVTAIAAPEVPFSRDGGDCSPPPFVLDANSTCTLGYRFAPILVGSFEQSVLLGSDANPATILLRGAGVATIPAQLIRISGSDQSTTVHGTFTSPLAVQVRDAHNNPVPGIGVEFSGPADGASAALPSSPVVTDEQGIASLVAHANGIAGSYVVQAAGGAGVPVQFHLTNLAASADIAVNLVALRDHIQNGMLLDHVLSVHNLGPDPAINIDVASELAAELDLGGGTWLCLGPSASGCTDQGTGELIDTGLHLPSGGTVSYLITAPVRTDADGRIISVAHVDHAGDPDLGNNSAQAQTEIVLFRNGFGMYGDGSRELRLVPSRLERGGELLLRWRGQGADGIETVLLAEAVADGHGFRIEWIGERDRGWLRLVGINADGERAGAWLPVAASTMVALVQQSIEMAEGEGSVLLLIGDAGSRSLSLAERASAYRLRSLPELWVGGGDDE